MSCILHCDLRLLLGYIYFGNIKMIVILFKEFKIDQNVQYDKFKHIMLVMNLVSVRYIKITNQTS